MPRDTVQTELPRLTASSVNDLDCPKKYKQLRIDKDWPARPPVDAVQHGLAVHDVLRMLYMARRGHVLPVERIDTLAKIAVMKKVYSDDMDPVEEIARVARKVRGYVACDDPEDILATIDLERWSEFKFKLDGVPLYTVSAKIDRIIVRPERPGALTIRDYKTGGRPKIDLKECFIFFWVARKRYKPQGFTEIEMELDWIDEDGRVSRDLITQADVKGVHLEVVEAALKVLQGSEWPESPGEVCCYCPIRSVCQPLEDEDLAVGEDVF